MERYNPWWQNEKDEVLEEWKKSKVKWEPEIINKINFQPFSLHFLTGPRQVGKTTTLKILINKLIQKGVNSKSIFYYQCDELLDFKELGEILDDYYNAKEYWKIDQSYVILDEITFVHEWWRAIKSRIDKKQMKNDVIIITGSASIELLKEKERFPGRRGQGQDLILRPLSFDNYVQLSNQLAIKQLEIQEINRFDDAIKTNKLFSTTLSQIFLNYIESGGFPRAIIDYMESGKVKESTKKTYLDWLKSDWQKDNKNERFMKEIISYLINTRLSPISWLSITKNTSIGSSNTTETYVTALENMYAINILHHISPDFKINYRKNKKIHFIDPFIYRLMAEYTRSEILTENIVESIVAAHLSRRSQTFYWKNNSEVDIIGIINDKQVGFEVKWGPKSWRRPKHLTQTFLLTKDIIPIFLATFKLN
ncbi:MAG: ATP-binding protein [Candidatus Helarchaeota archaeon]